MKRHYKKIFQKNPELLQEMLNLRMEGKSMPFLAKKYGVDHTSIMWQCQKFGVKPGQKVIRQLLPKCLNCDNLVKNQNNKFCSQSCYSLFCKEDIENKKEEIIEGEKINPGKMYSEYLLEAEQRKIKDTPAKSFLLAHYQNSI